MGQPDSLVSRIEALERRLAALESKFGPRDDQEAAIVAAIVDSQCPMPFTAKQLLAHAAIAPVLHEALLACDVTNAIEAGLLLRRLTAISVAGLQVERAGAIRAGILWRVVVRG